MKSRGTRGGVDIGRHLVVHAYMYSTVRGPLLHRTVGSNCNISSIITVQIYFMCAYMSSYELFPAFPIDLTSFWHHLVFAFFSKLSPCEM